MTARGGAVLQRLFPVFNRHQSVVAAALTEQERGELTRLLRKVLVHVECL